jgi:hypothetical protein
VQATSLQHLHKQGWCMLHAVVAILYIARDPDDFFGTFCAHSPSHTGHVRACLLVQVASPHLRHVSQDLESSMTASQLPSLALQRPVSNHQTAVLSCLLIPGFLMHLQGVASKSSPQDPSNCSFRLTAKYLRVSKWHLNT